MERTFSCIIGKKIQFLFSRKIFHQCQWIVYYFRYATFPDFLNVIRRSLIKLVAFSVFWGRKFCCVESHDSVFETFTAVFI